MCNQGVARDHPEESRASLLGSPVPVTGRMPEHPVERRAFVIEANKRSVDTE